MIAGINEITGRADCGEAVLLQQRSRVAYGIALLVAVPVMVLVETQFDLSAWIKGGMIGLLVAALHMLFTNNYWLGYCDGTVVLVKVGRLQLKGETIVSQMTYPAPSTLTSGLTTKKVTLEGETYQLHRSLEERFRSITGTA